MYFRQVEYLNLGISDLHTEFKTKGLDGGGRMAREYLPVRMFIAILFIIAKVVNNLNDQHGGFLMTSIHVLG